MRNKLFLIGIIFPAVLGCGIMDRAKDAAIGSNSSNMAANVNANKTITDKAIDAAAGDKKIGILECDEAIDILSAQADNPDDNFVTKAVKKTALSTFREQLKKQIEQQNHDRTEVAKFCREFRDNLESSVNENSNTSP